MRSPQLSLVLYLLFATQQTIAGPLKVAGRGSGPLNTTSTLGGDATPTGIGHPGSRNLTSTRPATTTPHPQYQMLTEVSIDIPESMLTETLLEKATGPKTIVLIPIDELTTRPVNRTRATSTPDAFPTIPSLNMTSTLHSNSSHRTSERATSTSAAPRITSLEPQTPPRPSHNATLTAPETRAHNSTVIVTTPPASSTSESSGKTSLTATTTEPSIFVPPVPTLPANQTRLANHTHAATSSKTKSPTDITSISIPMTTTTATTTTISATRTEPYYMTSEIPRPITVANPQSTLAPEDAYQHNLDQARRFNTLYGGLAAGSQCTAGQVACIDGKIATCPATGAQFALASCGWSNLRCFVMPLNHTEGVVIGCNDVAEAGKILAPSSSSTTTSLLPFLTTAFKTTAPTMTTTTTTTMATTTAKNTTSAKPTAITLTSVVVISDLPAATGLEPTSLPPPPPTTTTTTTTTMTPKISNTTQHITAAESTSSSALSAISLPHNSTTTAPVLPKTTGVILRPIPEALDPLASGLLRKVAVTPKQTVSLVFTVTVTNEHYVTVTATPGA